MEDDQRNQKLEEFEKEQKRIEIAVDDSGEAEELVLKQK